MQPDMSETSISKPTGTKSENGERVTEYDDVHIMGLQVNDVIATVTETVHNIHIQKLLAVSLAVTMDKIRDIPGRETFDEMVNILHRENFVWHYCRDW